MPLPAAALLALAASLVLVVDAPHLPCPYGPALTPVTSLDAIGADQAKLELQKVVVGGGCNAFFSCAASEFMELFVGVGGSRVRDLLLQEQMQVTVVLGDMWDPVVNDCCNTFVGFDIGASARANAK